MARTVIDLDQAATILDVAEHLAAADAEQDIVAVGAAGAPWLRNAVFLDVAKRLAEPRGFALVTSDQRARSLAASMHVPAYASMAALDRHELDATERLVRRRGAPARVSRLRPPAVTGRGLGVLGSLVAAALLVLAVVVPAATVVVAPATKVAGPLDLQLGTVPAGDIPRRVLSETLVTRVQGAATGSREELVKAKGTVVLSNKQTQSRRILKGTIFRTSDGIQFASTEEKTLPASVIFGPVSLTIGTVDVPVEAVIAGKAGNVAAGRITTGPAPNDYLVNNPQPTAGGDAKQIPIVQRQDYTAAAASARVAPAVNARAQTRLAELRSRPPDGMEVIPRPYTTVTSLTPEGDIVGKEGEEFKVFELTVSFVFTAYAVPADEPCKTAEGRLRAAVEQGFTLAEPSIQCSARLLDDPTNTGVISWAVRISGSQLASVNADAIRRALAGIAPAEVGPALERSGVELRQIRREPSWWPRLPLLDGRISVTQVPATAPR